MKYFEEDIIGEHWHVGHYLAYETLDPSVVVVDTGMVTAKNTNREIVPRKPEGLLLQEVQNSRDHASRYLQRSHHPDSKVQWCWEIVD